MGLKWTGWQGRELTVDDHLSVGRARNLDPVGLKDLIVSSWIRPKDGTRAYGRSPAVLEARADGRSPPVGVLPYVLRLRWESKLSPFVEGLLGDEASSEKLKEGSGRTECQRWPGSGWTGDIREQATETDLLAGLVESTVDAGDKAESFGGENLGLSGRKLAWRERRDEGKTDVGGNISGK